MNNRVVMAILISAAALSFSPALPHANAQETLTYWYYQPASAGATRQPRTGNSAHFVAFDGPVTVGGTLTPGASNNVETGVTNTWVNTSVTPPITYTVAFVSINGGAGGDITVFPDSGGNLPLSEPVPVPNTANPQIAVNAFYFPSGGGPCPPTLVCGTSADIDQFGELQGALLDDTFVNVFIPPATVANAGLTMTGNVDGIVATTNNAVRINADQTTPTGGNFDRWVTASEGKIGTSPNDLDVANLTWDYALALYHSTCPAGSTWTTTPTVSQCKMNPTCPAGEYWNTIAKRCELTGGPGPICHMCAKGQICTEVGVECNCLRCTPEGQTPQPVRPMLQ
ncbi:MAG: hypothetical protein ABR907_09810 [Terracidiphilus sp.]